MTHPDAHIERDTLLKTSLVVTLISVIAAWGGAALTGVALHQQAQPTLDAALMGLVVAVPPLVVFLILRQVKWTPIRRLFEIVEELLGPAISQSTRMELLAIAVGAGVSEELLFRGLIPGWLTSFGPIAVLVVPNLLFGLLHAVTPTYAVFAFGIGCYFSISLMFVPNANLVSLMLAHAIYDFVCFDFMCRKSLRPAT
jgi:membrane protease YdiL (CAAX protease family)